MTWSDQELLEKTEILIPEWHSVLEEDDLDESALFVGGATRKSKNGHSCNMANRSECVLAEIYAFDKVYETGKPTYPCSGCNELDEILDEYKDDYMTMRDFLNHVVNHIDGVHTEYARKMECKANKN